VWCATAGRCLSFFWVVQAGAPAAFFARELVVAVTSQPSRH
jgi:hypothetical protein